MLAKTAGSGTAYSFISFHEMNDFKSLTATFPSDTRRELPPRATLAAQALSGPSRPLSRPVTTEFSKAPYRFVLTEIINRYF